MYGPLYLLPQLPSRLGWDRVDEICIVFVQLVQGVLKNKHIFRSCWVIGIITPSLNSPLYYLDVQCCWRTQDSCNFLHFMNTGMESEREKEVFVSEETKMHRAVFITFDTFTYTHRCIQTL